MRTIRRRFSYIPQRRTWVEHRLWNERGLNANFSSDILLTYDTEQLI